MHLEDPQFPPLLKGRAVRAPVRPLAEACRLVQARKLGAGDVVWSRNTGRAEFAVVLEPEVGLERALQMGPLLMVALGDCLGSLCPPPVAIAYGSERIEGQVLGLDEHANLLLKAADGKVRSVAYIDSIDFVEAGAP